MTQNGDNAGIIAHPPYFYIASVLIALGIDYFIPITIGSMGIVKPLAILLFIIGFIVFLSAGSMFRKSKQSVSVHTATENIIQSGIYAYTRNPIYLGALLMTAAGGLYFDKVWILIMLIPLILFLNKNVIGKEEMYLEKKFGDEYLEYKKKVRRWI